MTIKNLQIIDLLGEVLYPGVVGARCGDLTIHKEPNGSFNVSAPLLAELFAEGKALLSYFLACEELSGRVNMAQGNPLPDRAKQRLNDAVITNLRKCRALHLTRHLANVIIEEM